MKNAGKFLGIIVLATVLVFGMAVVGCGGDGGGGGDDNNSYYPPPVDRTPINRVETIDLGTMTDERGVN